MNYNQTNYQEIYQVLERNDGIIESDYLSEIFNAFQVASGQKYFKSRAKAVIDYLDKNTFVIIKFPDKQVELHNLNELEKCFQTFDREFELKILKEDV